MAHSPVIPNPGSDAARAAGCICAVWDNHRGDPEFGRIHGFWVTAGCPLHAPDYEHSCDKGPSW